MEEIEFSSWGVLDGLKNKAEIVETVGDLQTGHWKSVFCKIEDDYMELAYSDTVSNWLRKYETREEFETAKQKRKEDEGEVPFDQNSGFEDSDDDEINTDNFESDEEPESY